MQLQKLHFMTVPIIPKFISSLQFVYFKYIISIHTLFYTGHERYELENILDNLAVVFSIKFPSKHSVADSLF